MREGKGKLGLIIAIVVVILIAVVVWFFWKGPGLGGGSDTDNSTSVETEDEEEIPKDIVILVKEDKVTVDDEEFADKQSFKDYIEKSISDDRTYTLQEENSILATHDWVVEALKELKIDFKELNVNSNDDDNQQ